MKSPVKDEQPGPPLSQSTTGSFLGSLRDSKNPEDVNESSIEIKRYQLTVEQMLVLLLVIKVTRVLLDSVDAEDRGVNLLGTKVIVFETTANLTMLLTIGILDPDALNIFALYDVIPLVVRTAVSLLGLVARSNLLLEGLNSIGDEKSHLIPDSLGLIGELAEEFLQRLGPMLKARGNVRSNIDDRLLQITAKNLLILSDGGRGRA